MKHKYIAKLGVAIIMFVGIFVSAQILAAEVRLNGKTAQFKGLKTQDINAVSSTLNTAVRRSINELSAGEIGTETKDCTRIDLTNKQICIEITIEDTDKGSSPNPGQVFKLK